MLEKHNVDIRRATTKYKHTYTAFVETLNKELAKQLFYSVDAQELQDPEEVSTIYVKSLIKILSMIGMKPENAFKLDTVELDKSETYPEKKVLPEDGLCRYLYEPSEQTWRSKKMKYCLSTIKIQIGYTEVSQCQIITFCIARKRHDRAFLGEKLIHITERSGGH